MKRRSALVLSLLAVAGLASSACSDGAMSTAPVMPLRAGVAATTSATTEVYVLQRRTALARDVTASAVIGVDGGSVEIKEAGIKVSVPKKAVWQNTVFTVTARPGNLISYEFGPHGTTFNVPLKIEQSLKVTNVTKDSPLLAQLQGAYFADVDQVDATTATAEVNELLPVSISVSKDKVTFSVVHFSGYLVASGITR